MGKDYDLCTCTGSIPLTPLSYSTKRSSMFRGTQPSNMGCTNSVLIDGQVTVDCEQGTALIDCASGFNGGKFSDLSNIPIFIWNNTVSAQVSIVFRFYQQIRINVIRMFFWRSQSNSILVPDVLVYRSNNHSTTPSNPIFISYNAAGSINGKSTLNITNSDNEQQFQYLRIAMRFNNNHEWIFLSEVQFCGKYDTIVRVVNNVMIFTGNVAPYHFTQPPIDGYMQAVSPTATIVMVTCSLNVTIPDNMIILWRHNNSLMPTVDGESLTIELINFGPSDVGVYQCIFNNYVNGWVLKRSIILGEH